MFYITGNTLFLTKSLTLNRKNYLTHDFVYNYTFMNAGSISSKFYCVKEYIVHDFILFFYWVVMKNIAVIYKPLATVTSKEIAI